ncbi:MAG: hypothetical protein ACXACY_30810 [Candidatus Hodarchaeales archaeon]|jgi:hypothetical protein
MIKVRLPAQKTKYQPIADIMRDYQLSSPMRLLQIPNGYLKLILTTGSMSNPDVYRISVCPN